MQEPRRTPVARIVALSVCVLITIFGAWAAACNDGEKKREPTAVATLDPNVTPEPTSTPTEAPADPDLGSRLEYEGDFEGAIGVYQSVAAEKTGDEQQAARLRQAQLLVRTKRFGEALAPLGDYLAAAPPAEADATTARYMLASALDDLGDMQGALDSYGRYVAANGTLTPFARIEQAKLLARSGRIAEAQAAGDAVLASGPLLQPFYGSFTLSMGSAFDQAGASAEALTWYGRVPDYGGDSASALARSGAIRQRTGDPAWVDDYRTVIARYPGSGPAPDLLVALDNAGVPVSAFERGLVYYRAFRNTDARAVLSDALTRGDHAAEAAYYIAALDERAGNNDAAIAGYAQSYQLDAASPVADDSLWWRGRLLEVAGRAPEASAVYTELVTVFPSSQFAGEAGFHRGLVLYRSGDKPGAAFAWGAAASSATEDERARDLFWQGRAERDAGNAQNEQTFATLMSEFPDNFYALRAEVLLGKNESKEHKPNLKDKDPDWDAIDKYLRDAGFALADDAPTGDQEAVPAELEEVGLHAQSDSIFRQQIEEAGTAGNVVQLYEMTRQFHDEGRTSLAARAAATLAVVLKKQHYADPPDDLLRIAYPLAYNDLTQDASKEQDVPPLLLQALVRQESFYDPEAGSSAGALGLTQVVEPTGQAIANDLGVAGFTVDDLYRPKLSLRFGASYLSDQLKAFDGNAYYALAAYNGGPGTAANAEDSAGGDIEMFVEDLEFEETQRYVRLVMEHYARYRELYDGLDRPSLPQ